MTDGVCIDNVAVVLHRPRFPENIGAAARAVQNMGIGRLVVVEPETYDLKRVRMMATHASAEVVDTIRIFPDLKCALDEFQYVVGTTARLGGQRQMVCPPSAMARKLIPISQQNRVAVLFGPEDRGLTNAEIKYCQLLVNIPTAAFSSLNLAQAVMVVCYEISQAGIKETSGFTPRLANTHELEGMYAQLEEILVRISYINPENPGYWMNKLRHFFNRIQLRAKEVSIIRGICRQINWYGAKCYRDGKSGKEFQGPKGQELEERG